MAPKIFISYSWDDDAHKEWVRTLGARLRSDGVDVALDQWEVVPGDQLPAFMERAIRDNQFVVIICTPQYKTRSDARQGGVGYEGDIMGAEVISTQNHRKFIPVLRRGSWSNSAPSWLAGKYYINLSGDPYSERDYEDLVRTLLGIRQTAPALGAPMTTISSERHTAQAGPPTTVSAFEDIKITRVIVEEVTEPRNDGTAGSALYTVPFALSRRPPSQWEELFLQNWRRPPRFTSMHRPGIAHISGTTLSLVGTTIEEVEKYHRDTLQLVIAATNEQFRELLQQYERLHAEAEAKRTRHRQRVEDISKRLNFDE